MYRRVWWAVTLLTLVLAGTAGASVVCVTPPAGLTNWWPGDGNAGDIIDSQPGTLMNGAVTEPFCNLLP